MLYCHSLHKRFDLPGSKPLKTISVLTGINFSLPAGRRVAIMGASGAGKTTLLNILGGLERPVAGQVYVTGVDLVKLNANQLAKLRNGKIGFVYQFHYLLMEFTALENVAIPLLLRGVGTSPASEEAMRTLKLVGLASRAYHKPAELSGGERQRVAVARAIVGKPVCVMLDEPSGNLDDKTAGGVHKLLVRLNQELGIAMLTVTHDTKLAAMMEERYVLERGKLRQVRAKARGKRSASTSR